MQKHLEVGQKMTWVEMLWLLSIMRRVTWKDLVRASEDVAERNHPSDLSPLTKSFLRAAQLWINFIKDEKNENRDDLIRTAKELAGNPLADECLHAIEFFRGDKRSMESRHIRWLGSSTELYSAWLKNAPCDGEHQEIVSEIQLNRAIAIKELQKIAPPAQS